MNPEFRRQLWLQFSVTRLALLPILLAGIFFAVYLSVKAAPAAPLSAAAALLFGVLVLGLGTFAAGSSVMDEIADRTWDQQRMSAMQPWGMTWGKLAGSSAYGWYGGALCLVVALPSALVLEPLSYVLKVTATAVLAGVFLQALLIAINLQLLRSGSRVTRRGGVWALLLVLLWGSGLVMGALRGAHIDWWGQTLERQDFALASLTLFAACALLGAWRSMAEVLAVRQLPWGWPAMALVATAYISGFGSAQRVPVAGVVGLSVCAVLTYFALLTEPQTRPQWQRVVNRANAAQWRALVLQLPRWTTTLLLAMPFAVTTAHSLSHQVAEPWALSSAALLQPMTFVLLMGRDCLLALFFAFSPNTRRPVWAFAVLMLVLYALLPWLLQSLGGTALAGLVLPLVGYGKAAVAIAAGQLALALWLLRWRWKATTPRASEGQ